MLFDFLDQWAVPRLMRRIVADEAFPLARWLSSALLLLLVCAFFVATVPDAVVVETLAEVVKTPRTVWLAVEYLMRVLLRARS